MNNKEYLFDGKYTLDQALILAKKTLGDNLNKIDLLKALSSDIQIEFHCYVRNLPLLIELNKTTYEEGKGTIAMPLGYEINCYTGFFNLSLSDSGEGANYINDMVNGIENEGVVSIEGLDWEEAGDLVADLDKIKGFESDSFDCEKAKWFSKDVKPFEYVPIKSYQPTIEQLYIEKVSFNLWLEDKEFTRMTDGITTFKFWQQVFSRANYESWRIAGVVTTPKTENKIKTWAKKWEKPPNNLKQAVNKVKKLIQLQKPETQENKNFFRGDTELELLYEYNYRQLQEEFAYLKKINPEQIQVEQSEPESPKENILEPNWEEARKPTTERKNFLIDAMIYFWRDDFTRLPENYEELKRWLIRNKSKMTGYEIKTEKSNYDLSVTDLCDRDTGFKRTFNKLIIQLK